MLYDALIEESLCYKTIRAMCRYFYASIFFSIFIVSARAIYRISGEIIHNSEIRRLFISGRSACKNSAPYLISASISSILICYISAGLLVFGKIEYRPMSLFCVTLFAVYLVKKGAIKYVVSAYRDSYTFRLISKKI